MGFLKNKENSKRIVILVLLIMSFNFISPIVSKADFGGALFDPISELLTAIGDIILSKLQEIFLGDGDIAAEAPRRHGQYT